jgi:ATP-dependent exoDNAse (exonuclease V) beta subunit
MPEEWQSLAFKNTHPRDKNVRFVESTHTYYVNGSSKGIVSTTGFVHSFFGHFDAPAAIKAMKKNAEKWAKHPLNGKTDEEIMKIWSDSGKEASGKGTVMHLAIEQHLNGALYRIPAEVLETPEWRYYMNFYNDVKESLEPYRTEWEVWDDEHKLTGSIDMIFKRKDGNFAVYDWKRSKEIKMENRYQSGLGPMAHLPDTNYWHYTLQLNIYRWFLQKHYGLKVVELAIVILHPNNKNYQIFKLNILDDEVQDMLDARKLAIQMGSKKPVEFEVEEKICLLDD